jgi:hypothetical protein
MAGKCPGTEKKACQLVQDEAVHIMFSRIYYSCKTLDERKLIKLNTD